MPEWMYTEMYDQNHKVLQVSRSADKVKKRKKGIYKSFICEECEKTTQKYDRYASLILTKRSTDSNEYKSIVKKDDAHIFKSELLEFSRWKNINFSYFQKFIFSIILRSHFAGTIEGSISLTQKHLNRILALYSDPQNLDDKAYPITLAGYPENDPLRNHVILPYFEKKHGHHILEFSASGYLFNVYISSHDKPRFVKSLRLKNDESMYLIKMTFRETGLYRNSVNLVKELKQLS